MSTSSHRKTSHVPRPRNAKSDLNSGGMGDSTGAPHSTGKQSSDQKQQSKNVSHVPCKFFRQGVCQAGDKCPFSHTTTGARKQAPCTYFQKGNCKFGAKCALAHITPDGRKVSKKVARLHSGESQPDHAATRGSRGSGSTHQAVAASAAASAADSAADSAVNSSSNASASSTASTTAATSPASTSSRITTPGQCFSVLAGNPSAPVSVPVSDSGSAAKPMIISNQYHAVSSQASPAMSPAQLASYSPRSTDFLQQQQQQQRQNKSMARGSFGSYGSPLAQYQSMVGATSGNVITPVTSVASPTNLSMRSPSFGYSQRTDYSIASRTSSFNSTRTESFLFPASRSASMSTPTQGASASSLWGDSTVAAAAQIFPFEGSAIADDDDGLSSCDDALGFEESLVPSSLSELLTPEERRRLNSHGYHSPGYRSGKPFIPEGDLLSLPRVVSSSGLWGQGGLWGPRAVPSSTANLPLPRSFDSPPQLANVRSYPGFTGRPSPTIYEPSSTTLEAWSQHNHETLRS